MKYPSTYIPLFLRENRTNGLFMGQSWHSSRLQPPHPKKKKKKLKQTTSSPTCLSEKLVGRIGKFTVQE